MARQYQILNRAIDLLLEFRDELEATQEPLRQVARATRGSP
jgi:hypothetical protein